MVSRPRPRSGHNRTNKAYNADITLICVQLFCLHKVATRSSETDRSNNDRNFVAFGRKDTAISQIDGLDLCQG